MSNPLSFYATNHAPHQGYRPHARHVHVPGHGRGRGQRIAAAAG